MSRVSVRRNVHLSPWSPGPADLGSPGEAPAFGDVVPGSEPPALTLEPVTRTDHVRYQGASGDMNPIHHDEPFATESGYPAPLTVGMFQAGVLTTWATNWLGPSNVRRTRIRWKAPVFPGDVLTMSGVVAERREDARQIDLELACSKADGSVCVQAWMTFQLP